MVITRRSGEFGIPSGVLGRHPSYHQELISVTLLYRTGENLPCNASTSLTASPFLRELMNPPAHDPGNQTQPKNAGEGGQPVWGTWDISVVLLGVFTIFPVPRH